MLNSGNAKPSIFDADTPPDVSGPRRSNEFCTEQVSHPFGPLSQHLIDVPVGLKHHIDNALNIFVAHVVVKQIAHRVNEDLSWPSPSEWFVEFFRDESKVESLFVWMIRNATKSFRESRCVAVLAARADLCAAANRVPRGVGPFDLRSVRHYFLCALTKGSDPCGVVYFLQSSQNLDAMDSRLKKVKWYIFEFFSFFIGWAV